MATTQTVRPAQAAPIRQRKPRGPITWLRAHIVQLAAAGALIYMFLPVMVVLVFSFNDPVGRFNYTWNTFSPDAWTNLCGVRGHVRLAAAVVQDRGPRHDRRDDPRHAGRVRARSPPVPRARADQPADLPADGHARGRPGFVAAHPVPEPDGDPAGLLDHPHRPHHVLHQLRRGHGEGARRRARPAARAGGDGPLRQRVARRSGGSRFPLVAARASSAGALLAFSLSFDDFIITNFNSGVARRRSRCSSGARRSAASRRRSTSSARRCSSSRSCSSPSARAVRSRRAK